MGRSRSRSRSYSPRRGREPSPVRREPPTRCSLLLRNLSKGITIDDLRHYADKYGKVRDIYIPRDYYSGESRGIGFVEYWDPRDAEDAKYAMQGLMLDGRELNVMFAMQGRKRPEDYRKLGFSERRSGYDRGGYERGGYDRGGYDRGGYDRDRGGHRGDRGRDDYRGGGGSDYRRDRERDVSRSPRGRGRSRSPRRHSPSRSPAHGKDVRRSRSRSRDRRGSPAPNNNGHHSHSPVRSRSPPQRQPSGSPPRSRSRSVSPRD